MGPAHAPSVPYGDGTVSGSARRKSMPGAACGSSRPAGCPARRGRGPPGRRPLARAPPEEEPKPCDACWLTCGHLLPRSPAAPHLRLTRAWPGELSTSDNTRHAVRTRGKHAAATHRILSGSRAEMLGSTEETLVPSILGLAGRRARRARPRAAEPAILSTIDNYNYGVMPLWMFATRRGHAPPAKVRVSAARRLRRRETPEGS